MGCIAGVDAPPGAKGRVIMVDVHPARKADAAALAILVDIAGEGMPSYMWSRMREPGQSVFEVGRARAAREEGGFSYRNATVAEIGGEVAACLVDYRLDDPYDTGDLNALPDMVRPLVMLESKAPGSWYVNVLATFPEFRGQGIGARLLALAEERGRAQGAKAASIIVASENGNAMRLYDRCGYQEVARARVVEFPGCAHGGDWVLMVKSI
jgi:ribosomal protein S18 acetylase RimI-like enzyme